MSHPTVARPERSTAGGSMKGVLNAVGIVAWSLCAATVVPADEAGLRLPGIFTDHMVLQREMPVPVWGWADPGEEVTVGFGGQRKAGRAGADGKWMVALDPLPASAEPRELVVEAPARSLRVTLADVLVGDVWLCTGQSNMGMGVRGSLNGEQEVANAQFPAIRLFIVTPDPVFEPAADVKGFFTSGWEACAPQTVGDFSGVGYFFGRELHRELHVPIGLLRTSLGATKAEAWTSLEALRTVPVLAERAEAELARGRSQERDNETFVADRAAWEEQHGVSPPPVSEAARTWADPDLDTSDWTVVKEPAGWGRLGAKSGGVFWVRTEIVLPEAAAGKPFTLPLNQMDEQYDTAYFNGVEIARPADKAPDFYFGKRFYRVPGNLVKAGRNVVAVRIVTATNRAGMWQLGRPLELPASHRHSPDKNLSDEPWRMKIEQTFPPLTPEAFASRPKPNNTPLRDVSSALYNGMIAPLMPFAIKGAIWYQGESNTPRPEEYPALLALMIRDWRTRWGQGDFPLLIQQLVNHGAPSTDPTASSKWAIIREAQALVADTVPNCGIAVGIDIGEAHNIHPKNKQDAGKRLALVALEKVYGRSIESSGPRFTAMTIDGPAVRLRFSHATGLAAKDGPPRNFAIAGADRKFVPADARLADDTILVTSPQVPAPVAVRYAWADNPEGCNLSNAAGLPMAPFRTDDWPISGDSPQPRAIPAANAAPGRASPADSAP